MLPESGHDLAGGVGEKNGFVPVCLAERARDVVGFVDGVGVGEEEVMAAGGLGSDPACVVLAGEASAVAEVEWGCVEKDDAAVSGDGFGGDLAGFVGGVVVDDDQFPLLAEEEARFGLTEQRREAGRQRTLLVAGWDDDRDLEIRLWGRIRGLLGVDIVHEFVL